MVFRIQENLWPDICIKTALWLSSPIKDPYVKISYINNMIFSNI